ncbi:WhiB family transcriptional regulator [Modestobacter sp. Leaf380]|uniref:WhiB family transcriptional regulator n=1 Tax=Modestobacter sp. Leaf380 TaxID=1736356 RepID=UPI0009E9FD57
MSTPDSIVTEGPPGLRLDVAAAEADELRRVVERHHPVPCQQTDPDLWWPERRTPPQDIELAVDGCLRCPAAGACLAYALAADERFGVWGGLTPEDRRP